ncbi:helix-turn-helix domain-containing protein [Alkalihalophilus marmarensis]|uniref:helix-turn-helix domain-containing protein n=1 Tax=Alkalihalophilus marmarensis TaxID=521377 RepID=UPI002DB6C449|nr:helix-turn-helix transcriptional regulator [Alkalihalophilus marmarensis]MEC2073195.1 helix-turn-helix transcriptional regulator [Alkalihalophilus marmarensis]
MFKTIRSIRKQKGYTQEFVANQSGIARSFYTHIESGSKKPSVSVAKKIARTLSIPWTIFFEDECSLKEHKKEQSSEVNYFDTDTKTPLKDVTE